MQELGATLSYAEFIEWQAFFALEPFGSEVGDQRAALVAATIANANRSPETPPFGLSDFMLDRSLRLSEPEPVPEQDLTPEQLADWWDAVFFGLPPKPQE